MSCNNTNSTCSNCSNNYSSCNNKCTKCGCKDSFLTSPPPCPTPQGCPDPIPCQEVLASDCIIYTGPDVLCNGDIVVYNDATWTEVLEQIVEYFCLPPIPEITCNGDIVVDYDSTINEALEDIVSYFCLPPIPEITCNGDIVVSEDSSINEAFEDIVSYFCLTPIPLIQCGEDDIVQEGSSINQALEDIVSYFCDHLTTADNGLTMSPTSYNVQLGGPLIQNTTLTNSTFNLNINSTTVSALTLFKSIGNSFPTLTINDPSVSTTSPAIQAWSNRFNFGNAAVFFENTSTDISGGQVLTLKSQNNSINAASPQQTTPALYIESSKTASSTTQVAIRVDNTNNINPRSGIAIEFANSDATIGLGFITNRLISKTVVNTSQSLMTSEFIIQGKPSGIVDPIDHLILKSTGQLQLNEYGAGTFTGTPTYNLSTTLAGDIIETTGGLFGTAFRAVLDPPSISTVILTVGNSNINNGVTIKPTVDYQLVNGVTTVQYDPVTGIWTCPQTGKYDINYNVFLTAPDIITGNGWGDTTNGALVIDPFSPFGFGLNPPGQFFIGVTDNGTTTYCADYCTVINGQPLEHIYLTGGMQGVTLNVGDFLVLKVQNMTGISYVAKPGIDNIDWAIRRVG